MVLRVDVAAKGNGKTQVAVEHVRLPDAETAAQAKRLWRERLGVLKDVIEGSAATER